MGGVGVVALRAACIVQALGGAAGVRGVGAVVVVAATRAICMAVRLPSLVRA